MNSTVNNICIFVGGAIVGSFATAVVMKKLGYSRSAGSPEVATDSGEREDENTEESEEGPRERYSDHSSIGEGRTVDTQKIRYDTIRPKPSPEDIIRFYAEREYPREDSEDEDDGESDFPTGDLVDEKGERIHYPKDMMDGIDLMSLPDADLVEKDEQEEFENEIGEALMEHWEETDGFGHVICQLQSGRRSDLIYLIPEAYLGEIYPVESLVYYERDNVLCDLTDIPVDSVTQIVADGLEHFGECDGEEATNDDVVYIRNCSIGMEYEITRVDGYYSAHLYGVSDEEFEGGGMSSLPRKATKRKSTQQEED